MAHRVDCAIYRNRNKPLLHRFGTQLDTREHTMQSKATVPLSDAALRVGVPYQKALNLMLAGELVGGRDEKGRWRVSIASIA